MKDLRLLAFLAFAIRFAVSAIAESARLIASGDADWPQFRGPRRDGICEEKNLSQAWGPDGPKLVWNAKNTGRGFSSPIVAGDRVYITGDVGDELHIFALDLSGKPLWKATNGAAWKGDYPGSRAAVTFSQGRIYHENAHGMVSAFDGATGERKWTVDLLKNFGGENIMWGLSECLLVDERAVYATAGGKEALVVALDKKSGDVIWKSPPMHESGGEKRLDNASYASPIFVQFGGRRLIIGCSQRHLYCVNAANGEIQWTRPMPTAYSVLAMMPVLVGDGVFMTAPHGRKGGFFKLIAPTEPNGKIGVEESWNTALDTCQGGVVLANGKLLGAFYQPRKGWAAVDARTGEMLYQQSEFLKGAGLFADNRLYALSEDGWMRLLEPTESEFKNHGQFRLARASNDAWAHPVIHAGRLYLRYHDELFCYDVKAQ